MKTQKSNQIISYVSLFGYSCGDYAFAFCACLLVSFCITLTACGGGSSSITGGGNTGISGVGAVSEFRAQSGLALVSAASAYHGGHDGQSVKVGVVDSGIDASHSELAGYATGGGDWQSALGYLRYSLGTDALLAVLQMVAVGEVYVPVEMMAADSPIAPRSQGWLTGRERDVLNGLLSGQSNTEIARKHGLSEVTIKHHLNSLRLKL